MARNRNMKKYRSAVYNGERYYNVGHQQDGSLWNPNGYPETLVERGVGDADRAAIEARKLCVTDFPQPPDPVSPDFDASPTARAHDPKLPVRLADRFHEPLEILARLERPDCQDVVTGLRRALPCELVADGVRNDTDLLVRHSEQLDELAAREVGHRNHPSRRAEHGRHDMGAVRARPAVERFRVPQDCEVVDGHDERHA